MTSLIAIRVAATSFSAMPCWRSGMGSPTSRIMHRRLSQRPPKSSDAVGTNVVSDKYRLAARAVVCSGRVYVGDLGAKLRSNFTIIGPAVNETFRLEKVPDLYGLPLLVSASTANLIMSSTVRYPERSARCQCSGAGGRHRTKRIRQTRIGLCAVAQGRSRPDRVRGGAKSPGRASDLGGSRAFAARRPRDAAASGQDHLRPLSNILISRLNPAILALRPTTVRQRAGARGV